MAPGPRLALLGVVAIFALTGIGIFVTVGAHRALDQEFERRLAGGLVWEVVAAEQDRLLDAGVCDALRTGSGVHASGGVFPASTTETELRLYAEGPSLPVVTVTAAAISVWTDFPPVSGMMLGRELAELGVVAEGSQLLDSDGAAIGDIATLVPAEVALPELQSSVVVVAPAQGGLRGCWVRMAPGAFDYGGAVLAGAFAGQPVLISPYLAETTRGATPLERWHEVVGASPWAVGAVLIGLAAVLMTWGRRSDLAVYRTFGTSRVQLWFLLQVEYLLILVVTVPIAVTAVTLATGALRGGPFQLDVLMVAVRAMLAAAALAATVAPLASLVLTRGKITDLLKDR